ncbi:hypothetical protein B0J14DRAFT_335352 [Halenospora varia]|nr:hypothetical protein B0J14DRAFT_335352 [Halenospora varia]
MKLPLAFLLPLVAFAWSKALSACDDCVPEHLLRSEAFGIDIASDCLTIAVQHVNGTTQPIASTVPSLRYQSLLAQLLAESDIHPYGYKNDPPQRLGGIPGDEEANRSIETFSQEINRVVTLAHNQGRRIAHYTVSVPAFFTQKDEEHIRQSLSRCGLPKPTAIQSADFAAFAMLDTMDCLRQFEFDCTPISYDTTTTLFIEYSNATLSGFLSQFWGGSYYDRVAYFIDARLGDGSREGKVRSERTHWGLLTNRIKSLLEDFRNDNAFKREGFRVSEIVLIGQSASGSAFHEALREAFSSLSQAIQIPSYSLDSVTFDPIYVAALGAARTTKYFVDVPSPLGCNSEDIKCTKIRTDVLRDSYTQRVVSDMTN